MKRLSKGTIIMTVIDWIVYVKGYAVYSWSTMSPYYKLVWWGLVAVMTAVNLILLCRFKKNDVSFHLKSLIIGCCIGIILTVAPMAAARFMPLQLMNIMSALHMGGFLTLYVMSEVDIYILLYLFCIVIFAFAMEFISYKIAKAVADYRWVNGK
ncbi:MAG: hypothetical protein ACI4EA_05165 [Candidatus Ornithomonoglobus sp.]